ncbi:RNA polymerase sigma factor [Robiginitalea sp.]|nr:RNA polymerase sigma factor [Robiginitalea sp.]
MKEDKDLIAEVIAGDTRAFAGLVTRYQHMVFTLAVQILRNRELAEEAAQDVFVKAYRGLSKFKGEAKFSTWLYRIVYRHFLDIARVALRQPKFVQDKVPEIWTEKSLDDIWTQLIKRERSELLQKLLDTLPVQDRACLTLHYLQEQSLEEIAAISGCSTNSVKVRLFRARERLKSLMQLSLNGKILEEYER